jgi:carbohydrate-selective porin OprB
VPSASDAKEVVQPVPFSDAGWLLTNLFWHQSFFENRVAFVAGIVDTTDDRT